MQVKYGTYTGNGTSQNITGVGFLPDMVLVCSTAGQSDSLFKTTEMAATASLGLRDDTAAITTGITALGADGFSVGSSALANNNGSGFVYVAVRDDGEGDFDTLTYTGNGADNRAITGLGFQPAFMMLKGDNALTGCFRISTSGSDSTQVFYNDSNQANLIQTLGTDGFTLGSSNIVNQNNIVFYGFAFKSVNGRSYCFSYTGDGNDSVNKVNPGFPVGWLVVKARATSSQHRMRMEGHVGDNSQPFNGGQGADAIQAFSEYGFQLGTNATANAAAAVYDAFCLYDSKNYQYAPNESAYTADYTQPALPARTGGGFYFNVLDQQITTKQDSWNQDATKRTNEIQACKNLGNVTHIAIAVPYADNLTKYTNYVASIRALGLKVWHRGHWDAWEGDNSVAAGLSWQYYLDKTYQFIVDNPTLFVSGDMFGMCVEANNANDSPDNKAYPWRVGNLTGGAFDYTQYNGFLKRQISVANKAFTDASITGIYTFPISMSLSLLDLNGQVLDSGDGGNSSGLDNSDITNFMGGYLTVDHYMSDAYRDTSSYGTKYNSDLNKIKTAFPDAQLMIGEWGYHTTTSVTDQEQFNVFQDTADILKAQTKIVGVSYWVHMASNTASIFTDASGTINAHGRLCRQAIKGTFTEGNASVGRAISGTRAASG